MHKVVHRSMSFFSKLQTHSAGFLLPCPKTGKYISVGHMQSVLDFKKTVKIASEHSTTLFCYKGSVELSIFTSFDIF